MSFKYTKYYPYDGHDTGIHYENDMNCFLTLA
jgi:hypothetical protein